MKFTEQQKDTIYYRYLEHINRIAEDLENKTSFSAKEIIHILLNIIETEDI